MISQYLQAKGGEAVPGISPQLLRQQALRIQTAGPESTPSYGGPGAGETNVGGGAPPARGAADTSGEDVMRGGASTTQRPPVAPYGLNAQGRPAQATENIISAVPDSGPNAGRNIAPGARTQPGADLVPPSMLAQGVTPQQYADYAMRQARNYELAGFPRPAGRGKHAARAFSTRSNKQPSSLPQKEAGAAGMDIPTHPATGTRFRAGRRGNRQAHWRGHHRGWRSCAPGHECDRCDAGRVHARRQQPLYRSRRRACAARQAGGPRTRLAPIRLLAKGVAESANTITKLNAQLATAAKAMTARPSQLEFQSFQKNNPGLMNSVEGSKVLLGVLRQTNQQKIDLGKLAMDPQQPCQLGSGRGHLLQDAPDRDAICGTPAAAQDRISPGASQHRKAV